MLEAAEELLTMPKLVIVPFALLSIIDVFTIVPESVFAKVPTILKVAKIELLVLVLFKVPLFVIVPPVFKLMTP